MPALDHLLATLQLRVLVANRALLMSGWPVAEHALPCNKIHPFYWSSDLLCFYAS